MLMLMLVLDEILAGIGALPDNLSQIFEWVLMLRHVCRRAQI